MAASYLRRDMDRTATFSLYVRGLPKTRGFLVAAGLESCLDFLESFSFTDDELDALGAMGFDDRALDDSLDPALRRGSVGGARGTRRVLRGTRARADGADRGRAGRRDRAAEPDHAAHDARLESGAVRDRRGGTPARGLRVPPDSRRRSRDGRREGERARRVRGHVERRGCAPLRSRRRGHHGALVHRGVRRPRATRSARSPRTTRRRTTFLVDTYDTIEGVRAAIDAIRDLGLDGDLGVRLDSGDLDALARASARPARRRRAGARPHLRERRARRARGARAGAGGAPVDAFGIGTQLGVSADAPYIDSVYKLVEFDGRAVMKLSSAKVSPPGRKQVWRGDDGEHADRARAARRSMGPRCARLSWSP